VNQLGNSNSIAFARVMHKLVQLEPHLICFDDTGVLPRLLTRLFQVANVVGRNWRDWALEVNVEAEGGDSDGAAIFVVTGIINVL
jgi:hypothetical protein